MSNLAYFPLADDLIEDATITIITADANYPATKLQNIPMADTARASDPPAAIVRVRIDFGMAVNPRAWFFLNHNILSGDWIIHRTNAAWVSAQQQTVTYRKYDAKFYGTTWAAASQYFEVEFPAACTYKNAFWEMGKILCGIDITEFLKNFSPGIERSMAHDNIYNVTEYGVVWSHIKRARIHSLGLRWDPNIKTLLLDEILDFIETCYGGAYPVIIIPNNSQAEFYYMRNRDLLSWREEAARSLISQCSLNLIEDSRGMA